MKANLTGTAEHVLASRPTENPEAHQLYMKGRYFWNKRTTENLQKAIDYFEQAIGKDPAYALAYSGLADVHAVLPYYAATPPKDDAQKALVAARKAVELDASLAEAHTSLANALVLNLQFSASLPEFQRGIELNPNYATAHHWYGEQLENDGRFDEGLAEIKRAQELDPLSLVINSVLGSILSVAGQDDEAIEQLRKTIEMDPAFDLTHWFLGQAYENKGQLAEAIVQYEKAAQLNPDPAIQASLARAYALAGRKEEARKILDKLTTASRQGYIPAYSLAVIHLSLGDKQEALRLLEKSYEDRAPLRHWRLRRHQDRPEARPAARRSAFRSTRPKGDEWRRVRSAMKSAPVSRFKARYDLNSIFNSEPPSSATSRPSKWKLRRNTRNSPIHQ